MARITPKKIPNWDLKFDKYLKILALWNILLTVSIIGILILTLYK
jgi:hypothetical protein